MAFFRSAIIFLCFLSIPVMCGRAVASADSNELLALVNASSDSRPFPEQFSCTAETNIISSSNIREAFYEEIAQKGVSEGECTLEISADKKKLDSTEISMSPGSEEKKKKPAGKKESSIKEGGNERPKNGETEEDEFWSEKEYKPLMVTGEKVFILDDVRVEGNYSRFATQNYMSTPGFKYSSEMRLNIDGNIAKNISVQASLDDSLEDNKKLTLFIDNRWYKVTLGDFNASFGDTRFIFAQKTLKGIQAELKIPGRNELLFLLSRSQGRSYSEIFTGRGTQGEYGLKYRPVVKGSERVELDGRLLQRGTDYQIDYEDGSIDIKSRLLPIEQTSRLYVEYEYLEGGSAYRRNLTGARFKHKLKKTDYAAISILREADEADSPVIDVTEKTARPVSHQVLGFDSRFSLGEYARLETEFARSFFDPDMKEEAGETSEVREGGTGQARFFYEKDRLKLNLEKLKMDEEFRTIGKNRLDIDTDRISGDIKYGLTERVTYSIHGEKSDRSIAGDPDIPKSLNERLKGEVTAFRHVIDYVYGTRRQVEVSHENQRKESDRQAFDFSKKIDDFRISHLVGRIEPHIGLNLYNSEDSVDPQTKRRQETKEAGFGYELSRKSRASINFSQIDIKRGLFMDDQARIKNATLDLTARPNPALSASTVFIRRLETDYTEGSNSASNSTDTTIRWSPTRKIDTSMRYKELHTERFIARTRDILKPREVDRVATDEITIMRPCVNRVGSWMITYAPRPLLRFTTSLQFRRLTARDSDELLSRSGNVMHELKLSPRKKTQLTFRTQDSSNNQYAGSAISNELEKRGVEVRQNIKEDVAIITSFSKDKTRDWVDRSICEDALTRGLTVEKDFSRNLTLSAGATNAGVHRLFPDRRTTRNGLNSGFRLTPRDTRMTCRGNLGVEKESGEWLEAIKKTAEMLLDYDMGKDTSLTSSYRFTSERSNNDFDSYKARVGKMQITKRF